MKKRTGILLGSMVTTFVAACGEQHEDDDPVGLEMSDTVEGAAEGHLYQGLAVEGPWDVPAATLREGQSQHVGYDSAGAWNGGAGCAPGITPGAEMLRNRLIAYFPQIDRIGGYVCRPINGAPGVLSQHGTGRALDVFIPTRAGSADNTAGDVIGNWIIENAQALGVQAVIWDRTIWSVGRSPRDGYYTGAHPHHDHLHVEITEEASHKNAPWYRRPFGPATCPSIGRDAVVLSEDGLCFDLKGTGEGWRAADGTGRGGSQLSTRAVQSAEASTWARWGLNFDHAGEYEVLAYVEPSAAGVAAARYQVRASGLSYFVSVDQGQSTGWISLGRFYFDEGEGQFLRLFNNVADVADAERRLVADAILVRPIAIDGCKRLSGGGGVIRETSPCFSREGASMGWKTWTTGGHRGSAISMLAKEGETATNWARWRVLVPVAGRYQVEVFIDDQLGRFAAAHYKVHASDQTHMVRVDQGQSSGWTSLGSYDFGGGTTQYVRVADTSSAPIVGPARIVVDAIRVRPEPAP